MAEGGGERAGHYRVIRGERGRGVDGLRGQTHVVINDRRSLVSSTPSSMYINLLQNQAS